MKILKFNFLEFEQAWEGLNEFLVNNQAEITDGGYGGIYGTEMVIYNSFIHVQSAKVPDNFNFGSTLGYHAKKWSKLVANYVNLNYLDLVKAEVLSREKKKATSYNYTFHFDNSHGSGKDCLISLTFQRRVDNPNPIVIYNTRASEATKRMIFDFLLIQRMAEYVYGTDTRVEALLIMPFIYINVEAFLIYCAYKGLDKTVLPNEKTGEYSVFQTRVINRYNEFLNKPINEITYRVHKRSAMMVKRKPDGSPLADIKDLFAKDLHLIYRELKYAEALGKKLNPGLTI